MAVSPTATGAPGSCQSSYSGSFGIQLMNTTETRRSLGKRQGGGPLTLTLTNGVLKDSQNRIGYIAANHQFQFDNPVQDGTIYASGWAICPDNTLVLGSRSVFQQCLSGTFYNLYDENGSGQCNSVHIDVLGSGAVAGTSAASTTVAAPTTTPPAAVNLTAITTSTSVLYTNSSMISSNLTTTSGTASSSTSISSSQLAGGVSSTTTNAGTTPTSPTSSASATPSQTTGGASMPHAMMSRSALAGLALGAIALVQLWV